MDRKPTFAEKEKYEKFKDTVDFKQYQDRVRRLMDKELIERINQYVKNMNMKNTEDFCEITIMMLNHKNNYFFVTFFVIVFFTDDKTTQVL